VAVGRKNVDIEKVMRTDLSLPQRRRRARERWEQMDARINALLHMPKPAAAMVGALMAEGEDLFRAVRYLGERDSRLDLYRMCGVELPPTWSVDAGPQDGKP
jgi:hypothetical protein